MSCSACHGPFHPATGHAHSERTQLCGPCAREFMDWVRVRTRPRKGHVGRSGPGDFYAAAATSIKAR